MKALKELLLENLLLEQMFEYKNYDEVVKLAKNDLSFKDVKSGWGSSGHAFELQLGKSGKLTLVVDFIDSSQCLYMFVDNNKNELYCSETTTADKIDWDKLFNQTLEWLVDTKYKFNDALRFQTQKMKTAQKKYYKTNKSDDFYRLNSIERQCVGIERAISKIDELIKLCK